MKRSPNEILRICLLALLLFLPRGTQAADWLESPEIAVLFDEAGVSGTFVLYDVTTNTLIGHDKARAATRFIPASTFKIPHTLIGLAAGAVQNVDTVLPYKGPRQPFIPAWARDMNLRDAIRLSNVPIYQELARRIGLEKMRENLMRLDYGNREIGERVDRFWLEGPLTISALEQVHFLFALAQGTLPFPRQMQADTREITLLETRPDWKLFAKTGWQGAPGPGIGWWVGWVEKHGRIYPFALNIDIVNAADAGKRMALGKTCLMTLGVLH